MKLSKKLLLGFGTITSVAAPIAAVVSCGTDKYGDNWELSSHRDVQAYLQTSDGTSPWYGNHYEELAPVVWADASVLEESTNSQMVGLFRKQKDGYDSFKKVTTTKPDGTEDTVIASSPNRSTSLKFELIDKVTFQYKTGKVKIDKSEENGNITIDSTLNKVFDSDTTDPKDPKWSESINGTEFQNIVAAGGFVRINFHMNPEASKHHWIQQETGKKGSAFSSTDFFYGIMREIQEGSALSRYNRGETKETAEWASKETGSSQVLFPFKTSTTPLSSWENQEITVGLLGKQFSFENEKNVVPDDENFNLNFDGTGDGNKLKSFWTTYFTQGQGINAFSTDEVKNAIEKVKIPSNILTDEFKKTDLYKTGIYQLSSKNAPAHYVGGQYYISENTKQKLIMHINDDYVDQKYIKEANAKGQRVMLNTYTTNFIQQSDLASTIFAQGFKQGFTATSTTEGFSKTEILNAMKDPEKYGLTFSTGYTSAKGIGDYTVQQLIPFTSQPIVPNADGSPKTSVNNKLVYYNDGYAKVNWGDTIANLRSGKSNPDTTYKSLFDGAGLEFRTALQAAINTYTAVAEYSPTLQDWTSWFAPEGAIPNHDGGADPYYPAHPDAIDSSKADIKAALERITSKFTASVDSSGKITTEEHTRQSYKDMYTSTTEKAIEKYAASQMGNVKALMKDALDKAQISGDKSVLWEFAYGRGMTDPDSNAVYEKIRTVINGLDSRLNLVAKVNGGKEDGSTQATVATEVIGHDFIMEAPGNNQIKYWLDRIMQAKAGGTSAASLKTAAPYSIKSPASPMFEQIGFLQTGVLTGLSYYAAHKELLADSGTTNRLKPLNNIIDQFESTLTKDKAIWATKIADLKSDFSDAKDTAIIDKVAASMNKLEFKNISKSSISDLANYDYFGFKDLEDIKKLKETDPSILDTKSALSEATALCNKLINSWFEDAKYGVDSWMSQSSTTSIEIMDTMTAYQIISPWSFNPLDAVLGNRQFPSLTFRKNWFYFGSDENGDTSIDYMRVDLDKGEN